MSWIITKTCLFKYIENFTNKKGKFSDKNSDIFHISTQNIDCRTASVTSSNEYPQSMFMSRNKKNNEYPCKPQFYYIKGQNYIGMFSWCLPPAGFKVEPSWSTARSANQSATSRNYIYTILKYLHVDISCKSSTYTRWFQKPKFVTKWHKQKVQTKIQLLLKDHITIPYKWLSLWVWFF